MSDRGAVVNDEPSRREVECSRVRHARQRRFAAAAERPPGRLGRTLDARIARAVAALDGVGTVALFGSHARNRARPNSDLDVAILPVTVDATCRRRLVSRAAAALAGLAPDGRVDVVLVDEAPELLRQRIFEHGRVVIQRNPSGLAGMARADDAGAR